MKYSRIDGKIFHNMMSNSLNYLRQHEESINAINVFPVPDGDTGSNMRMTLENGLVNAGEDEHAGNYVKMLADGMYKGARGNSGVILALIFIGLANPFTRKSILDSSELCEGFREGIKHAYRCVRNPKEGTILTVAREGISTLVDNVSRNMPPEIFFSVYLAEMRKSLAKTPEIMPILKEAGVVDSGALGYVIIIEGALKFLQNEIIGDSVASAKVSPVNVPVLPQGEYGYCTEFILKLSSKRDFDINDFNSKLDEFGGSIVSAMLEDNVKVHIHTKTPGEVLTFAQKYGEFSSVKVENMALQAEAVGITLSNKTKELAKVALCDGDEACSLFKELGCVVVPTLNPSSEEIARAINETGSENVVMLTNNKNAVLSAEQAVSLVQKVNVTILETENVLEGYYTAASDDMTSQNNEYRLSSMREALSMINTFTVFVAARKCTLGGVSVKNGDFVTATGEKILETDKNFIKSIVKTLSNADLSSCSTMIIMKGSNFPVADDDLLAVLDKFSDLSINVLEGGFSLYSAIVGLI